MNFGLEAHYYLFISVNHSIIGFLILLKCSRWHTNTAELGIVVTLLVGVKWIVTFEYFINELTKL